MADIVYEYLKKKGLLTGDAGLDRRTYIAFSFLGDEDPDKNPLEGELEEELPEELQRVRPLEEN